MIQLYDPESPELVPDPVEAPALKIFAADDQVPFEQGPRWACEVAPGCKYFFYIRPAWWFRFWQRALLGWRWVARAN